MEGAAASYDLMMYVALDENVLSQFLPDLELQLNLKLDSLFEAW